MSNCGKGNLYRDWERIVTTPNINGINLIRTRIDVDYPYPSRIRSFIYTTLNLWAGNDYLKNSKVAAKMINQARREVKAYWFFTRAN